MKDNMRVENVSYEELVSLGHRPQGVTSDLKLVCVLTNKDELICSTSYCDILNKIKGELT